MCVYVCTKYLSHSRSCGSKQSCVQVFPFERVNERTDNNTNATNKQMNERNQHTNDQIIFYTNSNSEYVVYIYHVMCVVFKTPTHTTNGITHSSVQFFSSLIEVLSLSPCLSFHQLPSHIYNKQIRHVNTSDALFST